VAAVRPLRRVSHVHRRLPPQGGVRRAGQDGAGIERRKRHPRSPTRSRRRYRPLVTRATKPVLGSGMFAAGVHVRIGANLARSQRRFRPALLLALRGGGLPTSCAGVQTSRASSAILRSGLIEMAAQCVPLCVVAEVNAGRPVPTSHCFKAMGMGISDLALGIEILRPCWRAEPRREFPPAPPNCSPEVGSP